MDCQCMEFIATGWCTRKYQRRLDQTIQTIRNLTSGDLGIPLVVNRLGVTELEKARVTYLLDYFAGR